MDLAGEEVYTPKKINAEYKVGSKVCNSIRKRGFVYGSIDYMIIISWVSNIM